MCTGVGLLTDVIKPVGGDAPAPREEGIDKGAQGAGGQPPRMCSHGGALVRVCIEARIKCGDSTCDSEEKALMESAGEVGDAVELSEPPYSLLITAEDAVVIVSTMLDYKVLAAHVEAAASPPAIRRITQWLTKNGFEITRAKLVRGCGD